VPLSRLAITSPKLGRSASAALVAIAVAASLSGCGFIAAGNKSVTKPSGFVLTGQAAVTLPSATAAVGSPCQAPAGAADVAPNAVVTITSGAGAKIATGRLGAGIVTGSGSSLVCSFPFQIEAVPGNDATYGVAIGARPPQTFQGDQLREATTAVVTITPTK
jgi:hypothetical protein